MMAFRERARRLWAHMDGPLGILLVLIAIFALGWSLRAWQDNAEISRIDSRVHSVQASMSQLCTERVTDLTKAYDLRQQAVDSLMREQTDRITEQSARISEQSERIRELTQELALVGKRTSEIQRKQQTAVATPAVAKAVAQEAAKQTVEQTNEQARALINRAIKRPPLASPSK
jgi:glycyl-tRNA synthetase beta subunit